MSVALNPFTGHLQLINPSSTPTSPGGSNGELQYNDSGVFGGITGSSYNGTDVDLGTNNLDVEAIANIYDVYTKYIRIYGTNTFPGGTDFVGLTAPTLSGTAYTFTLPTDMGTSGYVLSTDGLTQTSWIPAPASYPPGGSVNDIQYNGGGVFDGISGTTYSPFTGDLVTSFNSQFGVITGVSSISSGTGYLYNNGTGGFSYSTPSVSLSIGTPVGGGNSGDILYVDGSSNLAQDNNFTWNSFGATLTVNGVLNMNTGSNFATFTANRGGGGIMALQNNNYSGYSGIGFNDYNGNFTGGLSYANPGTSSNANTVSFTGNSVPLILSTNNGSTTHVYIDTSGNVGIGKTPSYLLDVNGTINATTHYAGGTAPVSDGTYTVGIGITQNGTITMQGGIIIAIQQAM